LSKSPTQPASWPDGPVTVIRVRAPAATEIRCGGGNRRFVWRFDETGAAFRWFFDVDRCDDGDPDDDPAAATQPTDQRRRIRRDRGLTGMAGPPPRDPKMAKAPFQRGSQAGFTNADVCCTRCTRQIPPHREFLKPEIFRNGDSRPEIEAGGSAEIRFGHQVERLIALAGARPIVEILAEIGREPMLRQVIESKVALYVGCLEALGRETLAALGADRLPNPPIHEINASGGKSDG
jgi:hypothetical protein